MNQENQTPQTMKQTNIMSMFQQLMLKIQKIEADAIQRDEKINKKLEN